MSRFCFISFCGVAFVVYPFVELLLLYILLLSGFSCIVFFCWISFCWISISFWSRMLCCSLIWCQRSWREMGVGWLSIYRHSSKQQLLVSLKSVTQNLKIVITSSKYMEMTSYLDSTCFFSYKNTLYKNIEAENDSKIKNILRILYFQDSKICGTQYIIWAQIFQYTFIVFSFFCFIDLSSYYFHWCFIKMKSTVWTFLTSRTPMNSSVL